ncbi:hypothetical protein LTR95_000100 [Oleoguttula sp. CCFEE 5521]
MPLILDMPLDWEGADVTLSSLLQHSVEMDSDLYAAVRPHLDAHATRSKAQNHPSDALTRAERVDTITTSLAHKAESEDVLATMFASLQACRAEDRRRPDEEATDYVNDATRDLYDSVLRRAEQLNAIAESIAQDVHTIINPKLYTALKMENTARVLAKIAGKIETWERRSPKVLDLLARGVHLVDVPVPESTMVDTIEKVQETVLVIHAAAPCAGVDPNLTFDLEGLNLGHNGTISLMQIHVRSIDHIFLLDVATLGRAAFDNTVIVDDSEVSMRTIIEDASQKKLLWDCCSDSEALKALYNILLAGVIDVQLMDVITRCCTRKERGTVKSLSMALPLRLGNTLSESTIARWRCTKYWGGRAMGERLAEADAAYKLFGGDSKAAQAESKKMTPEQEAEHKLAKAAAKAATARVMMRVNGCPSCGHKEDTSSKDINDSPALDSDSSGQPDSPHISDAANKASFDPANNTTERGPHPEILAAATCTPAELADTSDSVDSFAVRPLPDFMLKYAVGDVYFLYILYEHFIEHERWNAETAAAVATETQRRLDLSQAEGGYRANAGGLGGENAAPKGWDETNFATTGPVPKGEGPCE